jgi:hypothetical protein
MGDPLVPDGVAEGQDDVVLAADLREGRGPEPPVQRLVGGVVGSVGHVGGAYRSPGHRTPGGARHRSHVTTLCATARLTAAHGLIR